MKPINEKLIIEVCEHIVKNNLSYRKTAKIFDINFKTVLNYVEAIESIDFELYQRVQKCLEEKKKKMDYSSKNLKNIYEEICEYYICGNTINKTANKYNSNGNSIHKLFHRFVKDNDIELYDMVLDMIQINKQKSITARTGIRKMTVKERLNLCRNILNEKLRLKTAHEKYGLDIKTIKIYVKSIEDVDYDLYNEVCKQLRIKML